jgi:hypothetical protein
MKRILLISITIIFNFVSFCYALETLTHETINEYIVRNTMNGFSLDSYLKTQLGIQGGIEESFNSKQVWKWFREGGLKEDIPYWYMPYLRSVNHFHNPLTDQGFSGIWGTGFLSGESSIQWSQKPKGTQSPGGYYSWFDVRDYFYKALTSINKTTREQNFADMFRGLGQLMHLVEDLSVPEHTRDDGHYGPAYEAWVEGTDEYGNRNVDISTVIPIFFDSSAIGNPNPLAAVPIANLFDTNQYDGTNPNITTQINIGLSEYTNANFFSGDTINFSNFPYPQTEGMPIVERNFTNTLWNTIYPRQYYLKNCCGETNGGQGYLLSAVDYLDYYRQQYPLLSFALPKIPILDNNVYRDYASLLIPRAIGYSAGLLDYFFRGVIDLIPDEATGSGALIVNNTGEDMDGLFELYYDDVNDNRKILWSGNFVLGTLSSGNNKSSNITFTQPTDAKEVCVYILVFKGRIGQEQSAVVGKMIGKVSQGGNNGITF